MGLALAVFAFLPLCQSRRGNIMVDTFTLWLPVQVQAAIDAVWDLALAALAALLAWRLALGAKGAFTSATTTMVLGMPIGWAIAGCAAMAAFLAVISAHSAARRLGFAR
jgi:TRAP-type C4-dicarboxylate transport system permease small subunit